jgi:FkbM family methyltransferase
MTTRPDITDPRAAALDPDGFNELRQCRTGPMLYNKYDIFVGGSLKKYGEFSWAETQVFRQIVKPGMLVVEAGANIGAHTVELARIIARKGELHAFEPQRLVFQNLCANLAINQIENAFAYQMALGERSGTILVPPMNPNTVFNNGGVSLRNADGGESVPLAMLDMLQLPACHFLKIDVEGMEVEVIQGAVNTIERYRPTMFVENDRPERSRELLSLISELNYDAYWHFAHLFNPENYANDTDDIFTNIASVNIVCVPQERSMSIQGMRKVTGPDDWWKSHQPV